MRNVAIVGIGHSRFGRRTDVNLQELAFESIKEAIEDSGVQKKEIENVTLGSAGGWYEEALPAVAVNEYAGFEDVGAIAPRCSADFVIVRGDLTQRIELLEDERNIRTVVRKGEVVAGRLPAPHSA